MILRRLLVLAVFATLALPAYASGEGEEETLDPIHHSVDAYYLDFAPMGKLELPRIFVVQHGDGSYGVEFYASSTAAVEHGGWIPHWEEEGAVDEAIIEGEEAVEGGHGDHVAAEEARHDYYYAHLEGADGAHIVVDMSITKHLVFAWLGMIIVFLIFTRMARMYKAGIGRTTAPQGLFQNMFETLILVVRDDIARPSLGKNTDKYLPYLLTAFFFILTCNLLGLIPFGATATSNLMVTTVLALTTFVITQFAGTKDYWKHIFWPPGIPVMVKPILIPVEILGIFTKPFALAIRLFANLTAGHLVILSLIGLIFSFANMFGDGAGYGVAPVSVAFSLFIYLLELLVSFIQAYVFTMLSALFIGMAAMMFLLRLDTGGPAK